MDFSGRHCVVTGGTGALGAAVVRHITERGGICHVPSRRAPSASDTSGSTHIYGPVDITSEAEVSAFYTSLPGLWASIHIAGGFDMSPLADTTASAFEAQWRLNTLSAFLCCREATRRLRHGGQGGRLVNTIARPALEPTGGMVSYSAAKAGVASVTQSLAAELSGEGILVNAVAPSMMDTPSNRAAMPSADHTIWPKVDEVAQAVLYLASANNVLTHGALVPVYGKM